MPGAPASKAITVVASHAIATAAAMATNVLYANVPACGDYLPAPSASVCLSLFVMMATKKLNPPACAYAGMLVASNPGYEMMLLGPGMLGAFVLLAVQKIYFAAADLVVGKPKAGKAKKA
mmetsp:Transcript_1798/g.5409  ORF Transcript_1798/g.5409 Transcript_1798/m.5409 type:complete len:120 (+) Transcript_1798:95-454(+)